MPFVHNTPESLLPRSDSRNPATTCRGITSSGRPCRRPLAASPQASALLLYCWQHKQQAEVMITGSNGLAVVNERTSTDTLVDRLGFTVAENNSTRNGGRKKKPAKTLAQPAQEVMPPKAKKQPFFTFCCFMPSDSSSDTEEDVIQPPPRPTRKPVVVSASTSLPLRPPPDAHLRLTRNSWVLEADPSPKSVSGSPTNAPRKALKNPTNRPSLRPDPPSETAGLLSLIPKSLDPLTTSLLLTELAKPISDTDEEGYIYIFWLTDQPESVATTRAASALLSPPSTPDAKGRDGRRVSDALKDFSLQGAKGDVSKSTKRTILLKIGRASNVQRRMNEWSRQCGYNLSLIRYYPYVPTSSPAPSPLPSPSSRRSRATSPANPLFSTPRKVPHAHRVERLIHIELSGKRMRQDCTKCGREHREWFEVEATREGVKAVDEVVRRWVDWSEKRTTAS